jgi:hypothetical protein
MNIPLMLPIAMLTIMKPLIQLFSVKTIYLLTKLFTFDQTDFFIKLVISYQTDFFIKSCTIRIYCQHFFLPHAKRQEHTDCMSNTMHFISNATVHFCVYPALLMFCYHQVGGHDIVYSIAESLKLEIVNVAVTNRHVADTRHT